MLNETESPDNLRVICTYPTTPASGGVVVYGKLIGIAEGDEDADGYTVVRFGPWVGDQSVVSSGAIAVGDALFCTGATPVVLSNIATGYFFGWANEALASGTAVIEVIKAGYSGGILGAGVVGTAQLATHCVAAAEMIWPIDPSEETPGTTTTGTIFKVGTSEDPYVLDTPDQKGELSFYSTAATSGTTYGRYVRLDVSGAGVEGIAGRNKTLLTAAGIGNAHGCHDTLEMDTSAGAITGLGTGHRGNVVVPDRAITTGTYYGAMAEIYPLGNSAALPSGANACLGLNAQPGTAMDLVVNAISIGGTDGAGKMIVSATDASPDWTGSIRILVNGAKRYLHFTSAEAS